MSETAADLADRYFVELAAAFVRGRRADAPDLPAAELVAWGRDAGVRVHKFKRNTELPRVHRVLGMLRGLAPQSLLDIGSGRGTFLWPLLDAFPDLRVTAVDVDPVRARDLAAVRDGGVERLHVIQADATALDVPPASVDGVTLLEVLEHIPDPAAAAARALRAARAFAIVSVPSKEDDNPEHIHLFDGGRLSALLRGAGAASVRVEHVLNHMIALARM
ncbi:MAG TPA: class I SAM-dependent methyltransferase [Haliangium sp.]|nr:class I SAM-dependent methyltransferase [Haliangium sp.]